jgi:hypothetical protein
VGSRHRQDRWSHGRGPYDPAHPGEVAGSRPSPSSWPHPPRPRSRGRGELGRRSPGSRRGMDLRPFRFPGGASTIAVTSVEPPLGSSTTGARHGAPIGPIGPRTPSVAAVARGVRGPRAGRLGRRRGRRRPGGGGRPDPGHHLDLRGQRRADGRRLVGRHRARWRGRARHDDLRVGPAGEPRAGLRLDHRPAAGRRRLRWEGLRRQWRPRHRRVALPPGGPGARRGREPVHRGFGQRRDPPGLGRHGHHHDGRR